jgi:hypothetical protein
MNDTMCSRPEVCGLGLSLAEDWRSELILLSCPVEKTRQQQQQQQTVKMHQGVLVNNKACPSFCKDLFATKE